MTLLQTTIRPRRPQRRGIILVFVVVLLVLLAIMGTAYLASTRADLVTIRGRGAGLNSKTPLLVDETNLDNTFDRVGTRIKGVVGVEDNLSQVDHPAVDKWLSSLLPERPTASPTNVAWPWIGEPLAEPTNPTSVFQDQSYVDPRRPTTLIPFADVDRQDVIIGSIPMVGNANIERDRKYPALAVESANAAYIAGDADGDGIADSFLMPLVLNSTAAPGSIDRYLDTQNGVIYLYSYRIVDNSAQLNLGTALARTGDFPIKPISNNAQSDDLDVNDETRRLIALFGDPAFPALTASLTPNYGFFRSNIGLSELIQESLSIYTGQTEPNRPFEKELRRLVDVRFPDLRDDPITTVPLEFQYMMSPNTGNPGPGQPTHTPSFRYPAGTLASGGDDGSNQGATSEPVYFRSFGDALEQQVLKRPTQPGGLFMGVMGSNVVMGNFASPPGADNLASLHEKGGTLLNSLVSPGPAESALALSVRGATPNFSGRTSNMWPWFPPDQIALWFEWTKNLNELSLVGPSDPAYGTEASFTYTPPGADVQVSGMTTVDLQRSIRALVTTRNGVSAAAPIRSTTPPTGMPVYPAAGAGTVDLDAAPYGEYPSSKVSAATGTKRQLWRAYWSAMTVSGGTNGWDAEATASTEPAFYSGSRYLGLLDNLTERDMTLIRSAIASCNTIDMRDSDDDITELDVELEQGVTLPGGRAGKLYARVFGTEKRPYITEVLYASKPTPDASGAGGPYLAIEIYNPHDVPLTLTNYSIGMLTRTGTTHATGTLETDPLVATTTIGAAVGGPVVLPPGQYVVLTSGLPVPEFGPPPVTATLPTAFIGTLPAGFATQVGVGSHDLVLARGRRADAVPTNDPINTEAFPRNRFEELPVANARAIERLVPMETIPMNYLVPTNVGAPVMFSYRRYSADPATGPADYRWKCVYGGRFYDIKRQLPTAADPDPNVRPFDPTPAAPESGDEQSPAWRKYEGYVTAGSAYVVPPDADGGYRLNDTDVAATTLFGHTLGVHEPALTAPRPYLLGANGEPIPAPSIQIQNFDPDIARHNPQGFPFGSPIARDGDILNVPYIGAYQILRYDPGANSSPSVQNDDVYTLFENNALPTDAFLADPLLTAPANVYIGRFIQYAWASDLFDHISARQAPMHDFYPDVPKVKTFDRDGLDNPSQPTFDDLVDNDTIDYSDSPTSKLAYVGGDGKVRGHNGGATPDAANTVADVVRYAVGGETPKREGLLSEDVKDVSESNALIQGKININTAPLVVLRMLPWVVDPLTGRSGDAQLADIKTITDQLETARATAPIASLTELIMKVPTITSTGLPAATTSSQLLNAGDLSGKTNKPTTDFLTQLYNLNRVSNLITVRSDVFTVYYSVQAWTYRPNSGTWNQVTDTRLVGERRGAFVLDRSQSASGGTAGGVLTFPIFTE